MSDQKRVFIIHSWGARPDSDWLPWLAGKLIKEGFVVKVPEMPDTDNPKIEPWTQLIRKIVGACDDNTYFVGHSIGCQAIMRYMEKLPDEQKCGGAVFVAGWISLSGIEKRQEKMISSPWLNLPIDFEKVKARAKKFICIFSDEDPYVPNENHELFSQKLGAEIIVESNRGHFTGDDGIIELPSAREAIIGLSEMKKV